MSLLRGSGRGASRASVGVSGAREALGQQLRQVVGNALTQLLRRRKLLVGGDLLGSDAIQQPLQGRLALRCRGLEVDQPGFLTRKLVLVLQARDLHAGGNPAIALPVEADEDIALRQVGAVEFTWWVGTSPRLEEHRGQPQLCDGFTGGCTL